jgi:hypothetical protein
MSQTIIVLLPVFLTIAIGAVLKQTGLVRDEHWASVEHVAYYVLFPAIVTKSIAVADFLRRSGCPHGVGNDPRHPDHVRTGARLAPALAGRFEYGWPGVFQFLPGCHAVAYVSCAGHHAFVVRSAGHCPCCTCRCSHDPVAQCGRCQCAVGLCIRHRSQRQRCDEIARCQSVRSVERSRHHLEPDGTGPCRAD